MRYDSKVTQQKRGRPGRPVRGRTDGERERGSERERGIERDFSL